MSEHHPIPTSSLIALVAGGVGALFLGFGIAHEFGAYPPYSKDAANAAYGIAAILGVVAVMAQVVRSVPFISEYDPKRNTGCPDEKDR